MEEMNRLLFDELRFLGGGPTFDEARRMSREEMLTPYSCGCIPLRHAIRGASASLDVVSLLLNGAPESVSVCNKHKNIVLSGLRKDTPREVALLIVEMTPPSALLQQDEDGDLPLHCLIQNHVSDEVLRSTIEHCPPQVFSTSNKQGRYLLHEAIHESASPEIVRLLIDRSFPSILGTRDADGKLPLHCLGSKASLDLAELLIDKSPRGAISQVDKRNRTPLHCAVMAFAPVEVIEFLLTKSPESCLYQPDRKGMLPLHSFLDSASIDVKRKHEILQLLVQKSPQRVYGTADGKGRLPLHYISHPYDLGDIQEIVSRSSPVSLRQRDCHGRTPLHRVLEDRHVTVDVVKLLTPHTVPFGEVLLTADTGGRTLLHAAVHGLVGSEVIYHLLNNAGTYLHQVLTAPDIYGKLPLHYVLDYVHRVDISSSLVEALVGPFPFRTLVIPDNKGQIALHIAILSRAPIFVLRLIVNGCPPNVFSTSDKRGRTPLECAIDQGASVNIVEMLIERTLPEYLCRSDRDGKTLLHKLQRTSSPEVVTLLIRRSPKILLLPDNQGRLVIHYAVQQKVSLRVMEILLRECPESLRITDHDGQLPVHLACNIRINVAVALIEQSGHDALLTRNNDGMLPLHRVILDHALPEIVEKFVDYCPEALLCFDGAGHLPLFYALQRLLYGFDGSPAAIVEMLIRRSAASLTMADPLDRLPLHECMILNVPIDRPVVQMLHSFPDAAKHADHVGKLPLHYALEKGINSTVVELLLENFPGAVNWRDGSGLSPLEIACEHDASLNVVYSLYRSAPVLKTLRSEEETTDGCSRVEE